MQDAITENQDLAWFYLGRLIFAELLELPNFGDPQSLVGQPLRPSIFPIDPIRLYNWIEPLKPIAVFDTTDPLGRLRFGLSESILCVSEDE